MEFNELVLKKREEKNISRYKLAKLTGIDYRNLQYLEKGEIKNTRLKTAVKLAEVLEIDLNVLKEERKWR